MLSRIVIVVRANQGSPVPYGKITVAYRIGKGRGIVFKLVELPSVSEVRLNVRGPIGRSRQHGGPS